MHGFMVLCGQAPPAACFDENVETLAVFASNGERQREWRRRAEERRNERIAVALKTIRPTWVSSRQVPEEP